MRCEDRGLEKGRESRGREVTWKVFVAGEDIFHENACLEQKMSHDKILTSIMMVFSSI